MKNKKISIVLIFTFLLLSLISLVPNVIADFGILTIGHWDDIASGSTSGNSGCFDFVSTGYTNYFKTTTDNDLTPQNSFVLIANNNDGSGWWNISSECESLFDLNYIYSINFSFICDTVAGTTDNYIWFYLDGNPHIKLNIHGDSTGNLNNVKWYDGSGAGWVTLYQGTEIYNQRCYILITHNGTNNFNVKLFNSGFVEKGNIDQAGNYASNWTTFDSIYLYSDSEAGETHRTYFDEIIIDITGDNPDCNNIDYVIFEQGYYGQSKTLGIYDVMRPSYVCYDISIYGDENTVPFLKLYNPSDIVVFSKRFSPLSSGGGTTYNICIDFYPDWELGSYTFTIKDFNDIDVLECGDSYNNSETFELKSEIIEEAEDNWGTTLFAEFDLLSKDHYTVGDDVRIFYHMPQNDSATDIYEDYYYSIVLKKSGVFKNYMFVSRDNLNRTILETFALGDFNEAGYYSLYVYNVTSSDTRDYFTWYNNWDDFFTIEYISQSMYVYGSEDEYNNIVNPDEYPPILPTISQPLGSIVGLIITIFCVLIPFIVAGSLKISVTSIPMITYIITGGLGLSISTILGLFPAWLPFFIIGIGIIMVIFFYLHNSRSGGE